MSFHPGSFLPHPLYGGRFLPPGRFIIPGEEIDEAARRERRPPCAARQTLTEKWPVLTYGRTPRFDPRRWTFRCYGAVEQELAWTWDEFVKLPRVTVRSDIHCVTRWSKLDN